MSVSVVAGPYNRSTPNNIDNFKNRHSACTSGTGAAPILQRGSGAALRAGLI